MAGFGAKWLNGGSRSRGGGDGGSGGGGGGGGGGGRRGRHRGSSSRSSKHLPCLSPVLSILHLRHGLLDHEPTSFSLAGHVEINANLTMNSDVRASTSRIWFWGT